MRLFTFIKEVLCLSVCQQDYSTTTVQIPTELVCKCLFIIRGPILVSHANDAGWHHQHMFSPVRVFCESLFLRTSFSQHNLHFIKQSNQLFASRVTCLVLLHRGNEWRSHQDDQRGVEASQLPLPRGEDLWEAQEEGQSDLRTEIRWGGEKVTFLLATILLSFQTITETQGMWGDATVGLRHSQFCDVSLMSLGPLAASDDTGTETSSSVSLCGCFNHVKMALRWCSCKCIHGWKAIRKIPPQWCMMYPANVF